MIDRIIGFFSRILKSLLPHTIASFANDTVCLAFV